MLAPRPSTTKAITWPPLSIAEPRVCAPIGANGNMTGDGTRTFEWNARNELSRVTDGVVVTDFVYDAYRRRIRTAVSVQGVSTSEVDAVWCELSICEQRISSSGAVTTRNVLHGVQTQNGNDYLAADHNGTPWASTNGSGLAVWKAAFDPWGRGESLVGANPSTRGFGGLESLSPGSGDPRIQWTPCFRDL